MKKKENSSTIGKNLFFFLKKTKKRGRDMMEKLRSIKKIKKLSGKLRKKHQVEIR